MAQFSQVELQEIIDRDLPGHQLVNSTLSDAVTNSSAECISPSFDAMQNRYFGVSSPPEEDPAPADSGGVYGVGATGDDVPDDQIVLIERQSRTPSDEVGTGPKAVVVSGSQRRIIGAQG